MNTYKIGVIRVLTTEDPELLNLHGRLLEQYYPMFQTVSRCIPDQWEGIHDDATMAAGVPKVVAMARQMIVSHNGPEGTLLSVLSVALIFAIKKFLYTGESWGQKKTEHISEPSE